MNYRFSNNADPVSAFCLQDALDKRTFQCLFLYPSGIPNFTFVISLFFAKDGTNGFIDITVDPSRTSFALRSLV